MTIAKAQSLRGWRNGIQMKEFSLGKSRGLFKEVGCVITSFLLLIYVPLHKFSHLISHDSLVFDHSHFQGREMKFREVGQFILQHTVIK